MICYIEDAYPDDHADEKKQDKFLFPHNNTLAVDLFFSMNTDNVEGGIPRQSGGIECKKVPGSF